MLGKEYKSAIGNWQLAILLIGVCLVGGACRRDMQDQPKMKPYRGTTFFGDGLSARPPVEGTVARGYLRTDTEFFTGKKNKALSSFSTPVIQAATGQNPYPDDIDVFPIPVTKEVVERGRERYDIFCTVCHGKTGYGDGMIVRRGFRKAASFHEDRLRNAPVGHFFDAMTNGWGAMPPYAPQIPVQDRWAITAYIRALQASQNVPRPAQGATPTATPAPTTGGHK
jgi:mono/diheme cytochrome c family protein